MFALGAMAMLQPNTEAEEEFAPVQYPRCSGCPHGFARIVGHRGPLDAPLVVVGESPGAQEVKQGNPFIGPSGKVLEYALAQHSDIPTLFCNAVQCYPGTKTKTQDRIIEATHVCQSRLRDLLGLHPRKVILALGNPAVWSTTDDFRTKITQIRGTLYPSKLSEHGIVTSVHPAFLLRGGGSMRQFMADVDYAQRITLHGASALKRYIIPEVRTARTPSDVRDLARGIARYPYCAVDTETGGYEGFDFLRDRILCAGFSVDPKIVYVVPEQLIPHTREIFANQRTKFIWHNGKFDIKFFWAKGIWNCRVDEDTLLLSYAIDETKGIHDLEQIAGDVLGAPDWKFMIHEYTKPKGRTYADVPPQILHDYMAKDISGTLQVFSFLRQQVRMDDNLERLYTKTLLPQSLYMSRIEFKGIHPDLEQTKTNKVRMQADADRLEADFQRYAAAHEHPNINPRSPQQVSPFLYESLALRDRRRPNRTPESTDEDTLRNLVPPHAAVQTLLQHRKVAKALGTYINSLEANIGADGRVHTSYLIHGTTTGRPSSKDPNLLNIPREPSLRSQYRAPQGHMFLEVDINQAELRVLGELSKDRVLHQIYTIPGHPSIHDVTRIDMYGDPQSYPQSTWEAWMERFGTHGDQKRTIHEQKMRAKAVNFGIVYGRTAESVAEEFGIPTKEAASWIAKWFAKYDGAGRFINACRAAPIKGQNLITPFGFKRRFQLVGPEKAHDMQNQAANFPEQSIAWHLTLHTGMLIQDIARYEYGAFIVNTVYDSILFELPDDRNAAFELGARVLNLLAEVPKRWGLLHIPFRGDIKLGHSWGHLEEQELPESTIESATRRWPIGI